MYNFQKDDHYFGLEENSECIHSYKKICSISEISNDITQFRVLDCNCWVIGEVFDNRVKFEGKILIMGTSTIMNGVYYLYFEKDIEYELNIFFNHIKTVDTSGICILYCLERKTITSLLCELKDKKIQITSKEKHPNYPIFLKSRLDS